MSPEVIAVIAIAFLTMASGWCVWVTVSVFKHAQEIALIKREIMILDEVKGVLIDIRGRLK